MTLLIGFRAHDWLLMASDGRVSERVDGEFRAIGAGYSKIERLPCSCLVGAAGVQAAGEIVRFAARQAGPLASFQELIQIVPAVARGAHQASELSHAGAYNAVAVAGHDARQLRLCVFTSDDGFQAHDLTSEPGEFRVFCAGLAFTHEVLRSVLGWANAAAEVTPRQAVSFIRGVIRDLASKHPGIVSDECFFEFIGRPELAAARVALIAANNLITGTANRSVAQIEDGQTRAVTAIKTDFDIADNKVITASLLAGAVTAVKRVDGAIAQDVPDNRLWNNWFEGTTGDILGQPAAPTGYQQWQFDLGSGANAFTANGELDLFNNTSGNPGKVRQDVDWSMVGNHGEECVLTVEVKLITSTTPSHDFRVEVVPFDGSAEGTANQANFAGSNFNNSAYKQVVFKTTLPNMTGLTKYRIWLRNLSTGNTNNDGYRVRRVMLSRSIDIPRWTSVVGRDRTTKQVTGGGGGGGGGGTGGGSGCGGGCVL